MRPTLEPASPVRNGYKIRVLLINLQRCEGTRQSPAAVCREGDAAGPPRPGQHGELRVGPAQPRESRGHPPRSEAADSPILATAGPRGEPLWWGPAGAGGSGRGGERGRPLQTEEGGGRRPGEQLPAQVGRRARPDPARPCRRHRAQPGAGRPSPARRSPRLARPRARPSAPARRCAPSRPRPRPAPRASPARQTPRGRRRLDAHLNRCAAAALTSPPWPGRVARSARERGRM